MELPVGLEPTDYKTVAPPVEPQKHGSRKE